MAMHVIPVSTAKDTALRGKETSSVIPQMFQRDRRIPVAETTKTADTSAFQPLTSDTDGSEVANLTKASADLEKVSLAFSRHLRFEVDHESKEIIVKVVDRETDKVIRELPPEELKRLHSRIKETIGLLFDQMV